LLDENLVRQFTNIKVEIKVKCNSYRNFNISRTSQSRNRRSADWSLAVRTCREMQEFGAFMHRRDAFHKGNALRFI